MIKVVDSMKFGGCLIIRLNTCDDTQKLNVLSSGVICNWFRQYMVNHSAFCTSSSLCQPSKDFRSIRMSVRFNVYPNNKQAMCFLDALDSLLSGSVTLLHHIESFNYYTV